MKIQLAASVQSWRKAELALMAFDVLHCELQALRSRRGAAVLSWLLHPVDPAHFLRAILDRSVLHCKRGARLHHNDGCFGSADVWRLLERGVLRYGIDVDVTTFTADEKRRTYNSNDGAGGGLDAQPEVCTLDAYMRRHRRWQRPHDSMRRRASQAS
jgi:hypothetical protein